MEGIFALLDVILPPNDARDRRWWALGIVFGGSVFVVAAIFIALWNLGGAS